MISVEAHHLRQHNMQHPQAAPQLDRVRDEEPAPEDHLPIKAQTHRQQLQLLQ